ncbi:MAG: hypothetical protein HN411_05335 [Waddliaceae bacterium]|nr:hypothetical protein [Waddliaceae bacterium]MBT4444637.1 hypothetical protein [Waddliaceae bacterium]
MTLILPLRRIKEVKNDMLKTIAIISKGGILRTSSMREGHNDHSIMVNIPVNVKACFFILIRYALTYGLFFKKI